MEYSNVPVFIDVERSPSQFLAQMCLAPGVETTNPDGHMYPDGSQSLGPTSLQPMLVQNENLPTTSQAEASKTQSATQMPQGHFYKSESTSFHKRRPLLRRKPKETQQNTHTEKEPSALAPVARRIRCPECQRYTAETEEKMLRHIKKVHKGENPFQCYMCDYSTYNKSLFEEHVRIHQGIKPFKCTQCDYRSASKKNLKKHELIHRPNNPLKCKRCEFIARHPRALKRHEETHSGGNWLKFDSCKFQFQTLTAFKKHERTHKFKCKDCDFKSCSRPFLKRHMVKEHGLVDESVKRESFSCQVCGWTSSTMAKILLHLIHHPDQQVDESVIDVSILKKHGIL